MAAALRARASQLAQQVQKTAGPSYEWGKKHALQQYGKLMADNQQYVVKDKEAADKLLKQYIFTNLARLEKFDSHKVLSVCKQEYGELRQKFSNVKDMPLPELGVYFLFAGELYAWSIVGEIVGRGFTFSGYNI